MKYFYSLRVEPGPVWMNGADILAGTEERHEDLPQQSLSVVSFYSSGLKNGSHVEIALFYQNGELQR